MRFCTVQPVTPISQEKLSNMEYAQDNAPNSRTGSGRKAVRALSVFWSELWNPNDVFSCIQPVFLISYLAGVTPFRLTGCVGDRAFTSCALGFLNALGHVLVFSYCYISSLTTHRTVVGYFFDTSIAKIGDMLQMMTGLAGMVCIFLWAMIGRSKIKDVVYLLSEVDDELKDVGARIHYKKTLHHFFIVIVLMTLVDVAYILGSYYLLRSSSINPYMPGMVAFFVPHMMTSLIVVLFVSTLKLIEHRFVLLNKVLIAVGQRVTASDPGKRKRVLKSLDSRNFDKFSSLCVVTKSPADIIDQCKIIHNNLVDSSCIFDSYFSNTMLMIVTTSFLITVFDLYYIFQIFFGSDYSHFKISPALTIFFFLCQFSVYVYVVIAAIHGSSGTVYESLKTSSHVHQMINSTISDDLRQKLLYFSLQLIHRRVCFTAAGLFNIDRTLIFTLVGAATTYLVILLQFTTHGDSLTIPKNFTLI